MPRYSLTTIEDDIVTILEADTDFTDWKIKKYDGEVGDYLAGLGDLVGIGKTILVELRNGTNEESTICSFINRPQLRIIAISDHAGGYLKRKEELYALYENLLDSLTGKRLSKRIKQITPGDYNFIPLGNTINYLEFYFNTLFDYNITFER